MTALGGPTVLVPVGPLGDAALARFVDAVGVDERLAVHRIADGEDALKASLESLLRVGGASEPRLDAMAFVDLTGPGDAAALVRAPRDRVASAVAGALGRVFPADRPPEQRTAGLHLVLMTPALVGARGQAVCDAIDALFASPAPHPILARVWVTAAQTSAGVLTPDDLAAQAAGFALASFGVGSRDAEAARVRLAHPAPGEGPVGLVAVGALDVPVARIEAWTRGAAAWAALDALVDRVAATPGSAPHPALPPTRAEAWLRAADEGPLAERLKSAAWAAGGQREVPERVHLDPTDDALSVKRRLPELFQAPAAVVDGPPPAAVKDALAALDAAHAERVRELHREITAPLRGPLGEPQPLAALPAYEESLEQLARRLAAGPSTASAPATAAPAPDALPALEEALRAVPSPGARRLVGAAAGLSVGFLAAALLAAILLRAPSAAPSGGPTTTIVAAAATAEPLRLVQLAPWGLGGALGLAVGGAVTRLAGAGRRREAEAALGARRTWLATQKDAATSGPSARARERLALERERTRAAALHEVHRARERVRVARAGLVAARDALLVRLDAMGGRPSSPAEIDDVGRLLAPPTALHARLVGPESARGWVRRARRVADVSTLADKLVDRTLDPDGLLRDAPATDPDRVLAVAAEYAAHLGQTPLFDDPQAARDASERVERFAAAIGVALAPGVAPVAPDGAPARGVRPGELFTVGPADGRAALEDALIRARAPIAERLWSPSPAPILLFVRTWEGLRVDDLRRGVPR